MIPQTFKGKPLACHWPYLNTDKAPIGYVGRYQDESGKDIVPHFKQNGSDWKAGAPETPRPLFGLDALKTHPKNKPVYIVEGEKCASALRSLGITALTSLGGCKAADKADWTPLEGFERVYFLPDNDDQGEAYISVIAAILTGFKAPPELNVIRLEGLPEKGDICDWLKALLPEWNELDPIPQPEHERLIPAMKEAFQTAEPYTATNNTDGPMPLTNPLKPVASMTKDLIPEPFREWLADVSYRMQTPPDFAVISAITIAASVVGSGCAMRPKQKDNWDAIPNLWGACIGNPSVVLKTPSMKEPMQILDRLQAREGEKYQEALKAAEFAELQNEAMLKDVKNRIAKTAKGKGRDGVVDRADMDKLQADYMDLAKSEDVVPVRRLFKTNEVSIQSMTVLQNQNERGLLTFRDELTALLVRWDKADHEDERAYFLEGWNGDGSFTDFKIGRGLTEAQNVCISLLGGIQPDKLRRYLHQAEKGGNDGLMQRLQLAVWPDVPNGWKLVDEYPNRTERTRAFEIIEKLADMDFLQHGATQSAYDERPCYRFQADAQEHFNQWLTELQTVKLHNEESSLMIEHLGKYRSLMPSLALIFHLIDVADGKAHGGVSLKAAQLASRWCDYLETHARRIYAMAESANQEAAISLLGKIQKGKLPHPFKAKDVYDNGWHLLKNKEQVADALDILIDHGWVREERSPRNDTGRPPAPKYFFTHTCWA